MKHNYSSSSTGKSLTISRKIGLSIFTSLLFLTSCGNRETLLKDITKFNDSVQVGTASISAYYNSVNENELSLYWLILELNSNCKAGNQINFNCLKPDFNPDKKQGEFVDSPLKKPPIPIASIQARVNLLKEIGEYSKLIAVVAGDDSAEKFQGNIKTLTASLSSLEGRFNKLQGGSDSPPDKTISSRYLQPISTIISVLGKISIQESKWSTIRKSVVEAEVPVTEVLKAITEDLDTYIGPLLVVDAQARYALVINYYNNNGAKLDQASRVRIISRMADYKKGYDMISVNKPSKISDDLLEAHTLLVKLAKSDGSVKDISELRSWLDRFKDDAEQLKEAVNQLSKNPGGKSVGKPRDSAFTRKHPVVF
jgi:hypothetical protein